MSSHVMEILHGEDLDFEFAFEGVDESILQRLPYDSPALLELCERGCKN